MNDDEIVDFAAWGRDTGRQRALHRVHAARRLGRAGTGRRWSARTRSSPPSTPSSRSSRCRTGARRPPIAGATSTARATSASSRPSRSRSAATATGCASPPRASSAPACSRPREFDLRAILRGGGTDDDLAAEIERAVGTKWAGHAIGQVHVPPAEPLDEPDRRLTGPTVTGGRRVARRARPAAASVRRRAMDGSAGARAAARRSPRRAPSRRTPSSSTAPAPRPARRRGRPSADGVDRAAAAPRRVPGQSTRCDHAPRRRRRARRCPTGLADRLGHTAPGRTGTSRTAAPHRATTAPAAGPRRSPNPCPAPPCRPATPPA